MKYGVLAIALSAALFGIISMVINILPNKKLINYSILEQMIDIMPALLASSGMGLVVYSISFFNFPILIQIIVQIVTGCFCYVGLSYIFKIEAFSYIISIVYTKIKKPFA